MKTITIEVRDDITDFEINQLKRRIEMLNSSDWIAEFWGVDDVKEVRPDLSDEQSRKVLHHVQHCHDATIGITWDTLEIVADNIFPEKEPV